MSVTLYDSEGNIVSYHDLQDKSRWCHDGESMEQSFVRRFPELGFRINPEKDTNPYAPDLINVTSKNRADLKGQHSPFFKAGDLYGVEPTYAVVFNLKDKQRYEKHYPEIDIVYYVDWLPIKADIYGKIYHVEPLKAVYITPFEKLNQLLNQSPLHSYQQRRHDNKGNAKESFVIDIRNEIFKKLV